MMLVSTLSDRGVGSTEITNNILTNPEVQNRLIDTTLNTLKEKGYYGLNIYLQYLRPENLTLEAAFISNFSQRLHSEGFRIIVTVTPRTNIQGTEISYELFDYTTIAQNVDGMLFLSYDWAYSFGPPASATPMNIVEEVLIHTLESVPPEKIFLGFPIIGYDWQLPYIPGYSMARAVTTDIAIELASITNSIIRYNEISQAPYFFYFNEAQENHIVWFKDGRSIDALAGLVPKYDLQGLSIWNIMRFFAQMWFVLNTQYDFAKVDLKKEPSEK